ncbi:hypothetical protein CGLAMM_10705 [Acetobacteraceae bacterium EV16G]|uniref:Uncharacterized protein n=1 Tax=Sorlinia euscelidii TaxID=3081148 RepID=A0ABU7U1C5_9PROT
MDTAEILSFDLKIGFPGDIASCNPYYPAIARGVGIRADEKGLTVGRFVWLKDDAFVGSSSGWAGQSVSHTPKATEAPLGIVMRRLDSTMLTLSDDQLPMIPAGDAVTIARAGDIFVITETIAMAGQAVFAQPGTGAIITSAPDQMPADVIATCFTVAQGGQAGEVIVISAIGHSREGSMQ